MGEETKKKEWSIVSEINIKFEVPVGQTGGYAHLELRQEN